MAWLFSFWHLARITNRAVIAKLIPHHLVSNWNVWWQKRPRGLTDLLHPFLGFSSHVNTFCMFCHPAANDKEPCRNSGGAHPRTPRSAKRHTETQCEFTTKIWKEKKKKRRGQAQRTACSWGQMRHSVQTHQMLEEVALFQGGLHLFFFSSPQGGKHKLQISLQWHCRPTLTTSCLKRRGVTSSPLPCWLSVIGRQLLLVYLRRSWTFGEMLFVRFLAEYYTHTHTSMCEIWSCTRCLEKLCTRTSFLKV